MAPSEVAAIGLKVIAFAPYKQGKTVLALSLAELGPLGFIDTEARIQWYTIPHPTATVGMFPYDSPRRLRPDLSIFPPSDHPIYLVQTQEIGKAGAAVEAWSRSEQITGIAVDSGSILWDLLQDTRDDSDPKTSMLSWTPVKRTDRRFRYALQGGDKHVILTAHAQDIVRKVGSELVTAGTRPWLEKKSPHWADVTLEMQLPDGAPVPACRVTGEGVGGAGGLTKGAVIVAPTFKKILDMIQFVPSPVAPMIGGAELDYRNASTVAGVGAIPRQPGEPGDVP